MTTTATAFIKSFQDALLARMKNVLIMNFIIVWATYNYDVSLKFIFELESARARIDYLDIDFKFDWVDHLWIPLGLVALYIYVLPLINLGIVWLQHLIVEDNVKKFKYKKKIEEHQGLGRVEKARLKAHDLAKEALQNELKAATNKILQEEIKLLDERGVKEAALVKAAKERNKLVDDETQKLQNNKDYIIEKMKEIDNDLIVKYSELEEITEDLETKQIVLDEEIKEKKQELNKYENKLSKVTGSIRAKRNYYKVLEDGKYVDYFSLSEEELESEINFFTAQANVTRVNLHDTKEEFKKVGTKILNEKIIELDRKLLKIEAEIKTMHDIKSSNARNKA